MWPLQTLSTVAVLHGLAVIAPGPDFAIILRNSLRGPHAALGTAFGLASGIGLHATYSVLGLAWLLQDHPSTVRTVQVVGGTYLFFQGTRSLVHLFAPSRATPAAAPQAEHAATWSTGWSQGLLVNVLNPGAGLFVVSIFAGVVTPAAPLWLQLACAVEMIVATIVWFGSVALVLSRGRIRHRLGRIQPAFTCVAALALVLFGVRLLLLPIA